MGRRTYEREAYILILNETLQNKELRYERYKDIIRNLTLMRDETYIIYVNAEIQDEETELGRLIHDLHCKDAKEMYSRVLAEQVHKLKDTQEGVKYMCREMEELYNDGVEIGERRGEERKAKETAIFLANMGISYEKIAEAVNFKLEDIMEWLSV